MRKHRSLLIGGAAVLLLSAGIAALALWPEPEPPPFVDETPSPSAIIADIADLISEDDVLYVVFQKDGGEEYTIRYNAASEEYELGAEGLIFPGVRGAVRDVFTRVTSLINLPRVTENADDGQLTAFGLLSPEFTWFIVRPDGTGPTLMVGSVQATGRGRYARLAGSREVFLVPEWQSFFLTKTLEDMTDLSFLPPPDLYSEEPPWSFIERITLEKASGDVLDIRKRSEDEISPDEFILTPFVIESPVEAVCSDYMLQTNLLEPVMSIAPGSIEESFPADLSVYGLDQPSKLTVSGGDWSGTLLIGRREPERGGQFVMIEGYDAVLFDSAGDYSFLTVTAAEIRSASVWLFDIRTVEAVTFEYDGSKRVLRLEHTGEDELRGRLDGAELSENNARRLYRAVLGIMQDGGTGASIPGGEPAYRFTIDFLSGDSSTIELFGLSDAQFLIVLDGTNTQLYINRMSLRRGLLDRIDMLDRGEDLPRF
jgi:hypothetical protein